MYASLLLNSNINVTPKYQDFKMKTHFTPLYTLNKQGPLETDSQKYLKWNENKKELYLVRNNKTQHAHTQPNTQ